MSARAGIVWVGVLLATLALTCATTPTCPTTDCSPEIKLTFRTPIADSYAAVMALQNVTYQVTCPSSGPISDSPPRISCDANGITLAGIDLGHGDVDELEMNVELETGDAAIVYPVTIMLMSIANSMDCELVCYRHIGTVGN